MKGVRKQIFEFFYAVLAQLVECTHGKGEVAGSIPADGTSFNLPEIILRRAMGDQPVGSDV